MKRSYIYTIIVVLAVLAGLFIFNGFFAERPAQTGTEKETQGVEEEHPSITITAKHQFKDGTHIVAGEIAMPTPCHILDHTVTMDDSLPEHVLIAFTLSTLDDTCDKVVTPGRFKVEFAAAEDATIDATLNGEPVILNLIEAGPDEDLNDFEIYIKG